MARGFGKSNSNTNGPIPVTDLKPAPPVPGLTRDLAAGQEAPDQVRGA